MTRMVREFPIVVCDVCRREVKVSYCELHISTMQHPDSKPIDLCKECSGWMRNVLDVLGPAGPLYFHFEIEEKRFPIGKDRLSLQKV